MRPTAGNAALTAGPEQVALLLGIGNLNAGRAAAKRDLLDARDQFIDFDAGAIELDDQQRLDVERIAGVDERLGGVDRGLVHHLHAARNDSGTDDLGHAFAGGLDLRKADHQRARGLRLLQNPHRDLGDDAEQAFRPRDDAHQVVAARLRRLAADLDDLA